MNVNTIFAPNNTNSVRGICALAIFFFHILIGLNISPIFNLWRGMFVSVFLILSGYGINESYHKKGLENYWSKRFSKVIVPTFIFISCFSFLYPTCNLHTWFMEILYIKPTYWFVFHVTKCYIVYWIARRYFCKYSFAFMFLFALFCLNYRFCNIHLESEQAFSFFIGVLISEYKDLLNNIPQKKMQNIVIALFLIGLLLYCIKLIPTIHQYIGTTPYNYILCPFRLSWAIVTIYIFSFFSIAKSSILHFCGKKSLEIYIAHIPLIGIITNWESVPYFIVLSLTSFAILAYYTSRIQKKLSLCLTFYIIFNALFIAKYSARILPMRYPYITLCFMLLTYILFTYVLPYFLSHKDKYQIYFIIVAFGFICMCILQYSINPYSIQVDRWSALYFPIKNLLNGIYPYIAQTHLGGNASPFPIWQIFHIPFYLLGNVGLSVFFAIAVFLWSIYHLWGYQKMLFAASLLLISPAIWYEVAVRSDFITNILLLTTIINLLIQKISVDWINKHIWFLGIVIALFASTRLITLIPFSLLLFPFYFKLRTLNKILLPTIFAITFLLTFLPFTIWDWQDFFYHQNNPWTLQTRQGNSGDFIIFIPMATILAYMWKNNIQHYYKYVSIMLFTFIAVTMLHIMVISGNWDLFSSTFDITYYNSILPFAIMAIILNGCYTKENTCIYSE